MPEPTSTTSHGFPPDPVPTTGRVESGFLQTTALRYAAGDLTSAESTAFETRLANDQNARDALSEAVRLSAAALGQAPPTPHHSFRAAIRERLAGWYPAWLARRAYRGHPLAWTGLGAAVVSACTMFGLWLAHQETTQPSNTTTSHPILPTTFGSGTSIAPTPRPAMPEPVAVTPEPREPSSVAIASLSGSDSLADNRSVAEIWADLSTPDHVEKTHDEELRWRHRMRDIGSLHPSRPVHAAIADVREP